MDPQSAALAASVLLVLAVSTLAVVRAERPAGRWGRRLRSRLLLGVPWGTVVSVLVVLAVYLFLQRGFWHWSNPVTIPYRAWSYRYPLGLLAAGFSHAGPAHLQSNLMGTLVLAPIAEYAWSHHGPDRGTQSFSSWRTNPWIRAFVVFPAVVLAVGLLSSLFALGPVIGFSGVVFAFGGFALVHYPVTTVVALSAMGVVQRIVSALLDPVVFASTSASPPSPPWWATIAVQGHALGMLFGVVLGLLVLQRRGKRPSAGRLLGAAAIYVIAQGLWAVYLPRGNGEYVLLRGLGVALALLLALLITLGGVASDRPLVETSRKFLGWFTRRRTAIVLVVLALAVVAGPSIPYNLFTAADADAPSADSVAVEDYRVTYAENVTNELVAFVEVPGLGGSTEFETSGVIVASEQRHIWFSAVSTSRLAYTGSEQLQLGGPGWSENVTVTREGWTAAGNDTVYQVWIAPDPGDRQHVFASAPVTATARVDNRTVTVVPEGGEFYLAVERNGERLGRVAIPDRGESATAGGLRFATTSRDDRLIVHAQRGGTTVEIAREETYN